MGEGASQPAWLASPPWRGLQYGRALKVLVWDERHASAMIESVTGIPILSATSGVAVLAGCYFRDAIGQAFGMPTGIGVPAWQ